MRRVDRDVALLLVVHLASTAAMCGLIWFVQVVHYPLLANVGGAGFSDYERRHQRATAWVVGPFMAVEGLAALAIAAVLRDEVGLVSTGIGLGLLAVIHSSTVLLQVPAHAALSLGYDAEAAARLVRTNWVRTAGWTLRTAVAAWMLVIAAG